MLLITKQNIHIYKRNIEARSRNQCCPGNAISIKYSKCVYSVALFIRHRLCMWRTVLSCVDCESVPHFRTLSHKRHDFRRGK